VRKDQGILVPIGREEVLERLKVASAGRESGDGDKLPESVEWNIVFLKEASVASVLRYEIRERHGLYLRCLSFSNRHANTIGCVAVDLGRE
jgi:hypothetical protein